jgi:energy-coupling factor transporter ATP-binding protein EcfA2
MIRLEGVGYRYAGAPRPSVLGLDLELRDGEVVGVVGAAEAGKTTLCLLVAGLAPRAIRGELRGTVRVDGEDVGPWPMHRLTEVVGSMSQDPSRQLSGVNGSVFEEVCFGPMNLGMPRAEILDRAWWALDTLRITDLAERDPARLSGGQMQLVALAGLLAIRPRHLVLDEPTAQLDPSGTRLVGDALQRLASDGVSILIAEQKTDLLARTCDRVVVLDEGRIAMEGRTDTVLADPTIETLGVPVPSMVALRRAVADAGIDPRVLDVVET